MNSLNPPLQWLIRFLFIGIFITGCSGVAELPTDTDVIIDNTQDNPPALITGSPAAAVVAGSTYSFTPTINDDSGTVYTFSISNSPDWLTLDPNTGSLTGQPGINDVGNYTGITVTISNGSESLTLGPFSILVSQSLTYYIATDGSDSNDGLSLESPFLTLQQAIDTVEPGDTILIRAGTYKGLMIKETNFGTPTAWITMQPYNDEHVIIDGDIGSRQDTIYFYADSKTDGTKAPAFWTLRNLEIRNGSGYTLKIDVPYVNIYNNNLHGARYDIIKLVGTTNNVEIKYNEIHHSGTGTGFQNAQGIDMVASQNITVSNNFVHDIPSVGIYAKGGANNIIFENNLLIDILDRAIMLGQDTTPKFIREHTVADSPHTKFECVDCIARNNIVINAGSSCISTSSGYNLKIYNNTCYNTSFNSQSAIFLDNQSSVQPRVGSCNVEIKNNIIHTNGSRKLLAVGSSNIERKGIESDTSLCTGGINSLEIDNNIYIADDNNIRLAWGLEMNLTTATLAEWQGVTSLDGNSRIIDPKFNNPAGITGGSQTGFVPTSTDLQTKMDNAVNFFGLQTNSPAIDRGIDLPGDNSNDFDTFGVNNDFDGNDRPNNVTDIGAYER